MKKILSIIILSLLLSSTSFAGVKKGKGEVKMSERSVQAFIQYIRGAKQMKPLTFIISSTGNWSFYWYCGHAAGCRAGNYMPTIRDCEESTSSECGLFARRYTILWKNGTNPGKGRASTINSKWSDTEIRAKLTELGFLGGSSSTTSTSKTTKKKIAKKKVNGKRPIAISWDGYNELILGTVGSEETDDGRIIFNLQLPDNGGSCDGTYFLQKEGKGTWQMNCTNNLGAAGTLKHNKNGSITGVGGDYNDKKVKFTVSKNS